MLPENLTFACPACDCRLTVPLSFAGVIGPCPHCNTKIQAPALPPEYAAAQQAPVAIPAQALAPLQQPAQPQPQAPVQAPAEAIDPRHGYKPEPRQLPHRIEGREPIGKRMSESMRSQDEEIIGRPHRAPLLRILVPLIIVLIGGVMVFLIVQFLKGPKPADLKPLVPSPPLSSLAPDSAGAQKNALPPPPVVPDESMPVVPANPGGIEALTPPDISSGLETKPPASVSALRILGRFLDAGTLDERLPLIETATPEAELQAGCLASALPSHDAVTPSHQKENPIENSTDFYFNVNFPKPGGRPDNYEVLVRRRGDQDPKVVVDPFLDLYGGRLKKFIEHPTDKPVVFQVIVASGTVCSDPTIPNPDKKYPLKLSANMIDREIVTAYTGRSSRIGEAISSQTELPWGAPTPCTITLGWNTKEDPSHPFLEASALKVWSWNR